MEAERRDLLNAREGKASFSSPTDYVVAGVLFLSSLFLSIRIPRWYWLPRFRVFDEALFVRAAEDYLRNLRIFENTHPPLSKLLIALSIYLFGGLSGGDNAHGWRLLSVVAGAIAVVLLYALAKRVTTSTFWSSIAAGMLLFDGMHYVQSRTATPEGFLIPFAIGALYTLYRFWIASEAVDAPDIAIDAKTCALAMLTAMGMGLMLAFALDIMQHFLLGWPWLGLWVSVADGRTQGPGALFITAAYLSCGAYLALRAVIAHLRHASCRNSHVQFAENGLRGANGQTAEPSDVRNSTLNEPDHHGLAITQRDCEIIPGDRSAEKSTRAETTLTADATIMSRSGVKDGRRASAWLLAFALLAGAAVSIKWYAVLELVIGAAVLGTISIQQICSRTQQRNVRGSRSGFPLDISLAGVMLVALTLYGLTWVPDLARQTSDTADIHNINDVVARQYSMYDYHANIGKIHPYSSSWYTWPLDYLPVTYFYWDRRSHGRAGKNAACCIEEIISMPNPVIAWMGLVCVPAVAFLAWQKRNKAYALLVGAYLIQLLPWASSPRYTFQYHYYVNIPIVCLCNAIVLQRVWQSAREHPGRGAVLAKIATIATLCLVAATFIFFLPVLSAWPMTYAEWRARMWFPFWELHHI